MKFSSSACGLVSFALFLACEARYVTNAGLLREMPKNCTGKDFCLIQHENYPQKKIDELLTTKYPLILGNHHQDLYGRNGPEFGQEFCDTYTNQGPIYEIIDKDDNVRVVVQSPSRFMQYITIEQCLFPGHQNMNTIKGPFNPNEYQFSCKEKKMEFSFVVLSQDGEKFEFIKSKHGIPVCCYCSLL